MLELLPGVMGSVFGVVFPAALALIVGLVATVRGRAVPARMAPVRVVASEPAAAPRTSRREEP